MKAGKASIKFENPPRIVGTASVVGEKEGDGPLGQLFDIVEKDPMMGKDNWEQAESAMQKKAADLAIEHAGLVRTQIRYLFAGDLLGQLIATSYGTVDLDLPGIIQLQQTAVHGFHVGVGRGVDHTVDLMDLVFADHVADCGSYGHDLKGRQLFSACSRQQLL